MAKLVSGSEVPLPGLPSMNEMEAATSIATALEALRRLAPRLRRPMLARVVRTLRKSGAPPDAITLVVRQLHDDGVI